MLAFDGSTIMIEAHKTSTGHGTTLEDFEVIGREKSRNSFHLKVKKFAPKLNDQDSSIPLFLF